MCVFCQKILLKQLVKIFNLNSAIMKLFNLKRFCKNRTNYYERIIVYRLNFYKYTKKPFDIFCFRHILLNKTNLQKIIKINNKKVFF